MFTPQSMQLLQTEKVLTTTADWNYHVYHLIILFELCWFLYIERKIPPFGWIKRYHPFFPINEYAHCFVNILTIVQKISLSPLCHRYNGRTLLCRHETLLDAIFMESLLVVNINVIHVSGWGKNAQDLKRAMYHVYFIIVNHSCLLFWKRKEVKYNKWANWL